MIDDVIVDVIVDVIYLYGGVGYGTLMPSIK